MVWERRQGCYGIRAPREPAASCLYLRILRSRLISSSTSKSVDEMRHLRQKPNRGASPNAASAVRIGPKRTKSHNPRTARLEPLPDKRQSTDHQPRDPAKSVKMVRMMLPLPPHDCLPAGFPSWKEPENGVEFRHRLMRRAAADGSFLPAVRASTVGFWGLIWKMRIRRLCCG